MKYGPQFLYVFCIFCTLSTSQRTWAETVTTQRNIEIIVPNCSNGPLDIEEFLAIFRVELASQRMHSRVCRINSDDPCFHDDESLTSLELSFFACDSSENRVVLALEGPGFDRIIRELTLDDAVPLARARTVALAASELIRAPRTQPTQENPEVHAEPEGAETTEEISDAPPDEPDPLPAPEISSAFHQENRDILAGRTDLATWIFATGGTSLFGFQGGLAFDFARFGVPLLVSVEISALAGYQVDPLGEVTMVLVGGGVMVAWFQRWRRISIALGPRLDFGWVFGFAQPTRDDVGSRNDSDFTLLCGPELNLSVPMSSKVSAAMSLGVGYTIMNVEFLAEERPVMDIEGAYVMIRIGLLIG